MTVTSLVPGTKATKTSVRRFCGVGRVHGVARVLLVGQFLWLAGFSAIQYRRDSLTLDYSIFDQARYLIARATLDPLDTVLGYHYWRSHGELLMWLVAWLDRLTPFHGYWLLLLQAAGAAGAGWVALDLVRYWVARPLGDGRGAAIVVGFAALLLLVDPWTYWANGFDFHFQSLAGLFVLLACRDLCVGGPRWRVALWAALTLAAGDVTSTYLVGVGLLCAAVAPGRRREGLAIAGAGLVWLAVLTAVGANRGSGLASSYGYLAGSATSAQPLSAIVFGAVAHPGRALATLSSNAPDIWANLEGGGIAGVLSPWGLIMAVVVLLPSALIRGHLFISPSFQSLPCYAFLSIGSAAVVARLLRGGRIRRVGGALVATGTAGLAAAWAVAWLPLYPQTWIRVTPAAGTRLVALAHTIPARDEVIASQGVLGRLASRPLVYAIRGSIQVPLRGRTIWFVFAPAQGIEIPVQGTYAMMAEVAKLPGSHLEVEGNGIWAFAWQRPRAQRSLLLSDRTDVVPGWATPGPAGEALTAGPLSDWRAASLGRPGYLVSGDYWYRTEGNDEARVVLSASGPVSVEVWDSASGQLLAERQVASTDGRVQVLIPFRQPRRGDAPLPNGPALLRLALVRPPDPGWPVEVRVYTAGGTVDSVYSVQVVSRS